MPPIPSEQSHTSRLGGVVEGYTPPDHHRPDPYNQLAAASAPRRAHQAPWIWLSVVVLLLLIAGILAYDFVFSRPAPKPALALPRQAQNQLPVAPPPPVEPLPDRPSAFAETPQPLPETAAPEQPKPAAPRKRRAAVPPKTLAFSPDTSTAEPAQAPPSDVLLPPPSIKAPASTPAQLLPSPHRTHWYATATFEPARQSGLRHVVGRLPGFRRFNQYTGPTEGFVMPRALRPISFVLPEGASPELIARKRMDVKASLEASGRVSRVELLALPDQELVTLLSYAANQWEFEPARVNGKPVATEIILHFSLNEK